MEEKYQKFLETDFAVFDLETSGLNPAYDEILEIAAVKLKGKEIVGRLEHLVQPSRSIPAEVEKINGLNEIYLLVNGRHIRDALVDFLKFIGDSIVVGHNIREFDWPFVLSHLQKLSYPTPQNKLIDTLELSRKLLRLPRYTLCDVAKNFNFEPVNAHRALPDAELNAQVFLALMELLLNKKEN